jgi:hypothetical protein
MKLSDVKSCGKKDPVGKNMANMIWECQVRGKDSITIKLAQDWQE